jgi:hypothetical protein
MRIIHLAARSGSQYAICGLSDYGDANDPRMYIDPAHVPLWLLPSVKELAADTGAQMATFAMCNYGASRQDYTSLLFSPGLTAHLSAFDSLRTYVCMTAQTATISTTVTPRPRSTNPRSPHSSVSPSATRSHLSASPPRPLRRIHPRNRQP